MAWRSLRPRYPILLGWIIIRLCVVYPFFVHIFLLAWLGLDSHCFSGYPQLGVYLAARPKTWLDQVVVR